jgi:UDP-2-acetamido-2,6-beta-L-arabino-hexul-4-ose reductase
MKECLKELTVHQCPNGVLYEFFWGDIGQMAIRTVWSGETAGGHKHPNTNEWWLVVRGEAIIYLEYPNRNRMMYPVSGENPTLISVPAGTGHDIKNVGDEDVIFIFFADRLYDPENPDKEAWSWE